MPTNFRREMFISTFVIGGSVIVFGASFYFLSGALHREAEKIVTDKNLIAQDSAALAALAELKTSASQAAVYQNAMNKLLVPKDQLLDFPRWLDSLARVRQVGFTFSFAGGESPPKENFPGFVGFSLDASGSIENLTAFIKDIELQSARFVVRLEGFDLARSESNYRITSRGKVFFK